MLDTGNSAVLAFVRGYGEEGVLVVSNLSGSAQEAKIDLAGYVGAGMIDMLKDGEELADVSREPFRTVLEPHGYYWLRLEGPPSA